MIYESLIVNEDTLAILPAESYEYESVLLSKGGQRTKVMRAQTEIIKDSCTEYMEPYEYVRKIIKDTFEYHQKTPIFICPNLFIYMFPTCSPSNENVIWINAIHVAATYKNPLNDGHTDIIFKCKTELTVDVSLHTIKEQYKRTHKIMCEVSRARCVNHFYR